MLFQEALDSQDHAGGAVAALKSNLLFKCLLDWMIATQPLYCCDFTPLCKWSQENARRDGPAINECCTGSTYSNSTGRPHTSEVEVTAQHVEEHVVRLHLKLCRSSVQGEVNFHGRPPSACAASPCSIPCL